MEERCPFQIIICLIFLTSSLTIYLIQKFCTNIVKFKFDPNLITGLELQQEVARRPEAVVGSYTRVAQSGGGGSWPRRGTMDDRR